MMLRGEQKFSRCCSLNRQASVAFSWQLESSTRKEHGNSGERANQSLERTRWAPMVRLRRFGIVAHRSAPDPLGRRENVVQHEEASRVLTLFEEKAGYLLELSATKELLKAQRSNLHFDCETGWTSSYHGPGGEAVDAFALTLRLFVQQREPISIRRMKALYPTLEVPEAIRLEFLEACERLNAYVDSATGLSIEEGKQLSNREISEIFLFGNLAHVENRQKRETFEALRGGPFFSAFQIHFGMVLRAFVVAIGVLRNINRRALDHLRSAA